jgi:hypothetical protein
MGHDINVFGNHKLDISSLEAFAQDIAKRTGYSVNYGYYDFLGLSEKGQTIKPTMDRRPLGEINIYGSEKTIYIDDNNFQYRLLENKYKNDVLNLPLAINDKHFREEYEIAIKSKSYELHIHDTTENRYYANVFNDNLIFHDWDFPTRWSGFCTAFTKDDWGVTFDDVQKFRKTVRNFYLKFGGTEVAYLNDQGEMAKFIQGENDWFTILNKLYTTYKAETLNVSRFMTNIQLRPEDQFPLAFYDDFADLT